MKFKVYGRIATMKLFRPAVCCVLGNSLLLLFFLIIVTKAEERDWLFVSTEEYAYVILAYDDATGEIVSKAKGSAMVWFIHSKD